MELYADATGCTVVEPPENSDSVLLGTAMAAATAAGLYPSLAHACVDMQQRGRERKPSGAARTRFERDYRVFLKMHEHRRCIDKISGCMLH
jgi:ribulose kinase